MAFRAGRYAEITVNSKDLSAFCDSADLSIDSDMLDTSTFGNVWKTALSGQMGGTLALTGKFDPTITTGPAFVLFAAQIAGVSVPVVLKPGGTLGGQRTNTFNALISNYSESSPVADVVTFSCSLQTDGAVVPSTQ